MKWSIAAAALLAACVLGVPAHARSINGSSDTPPPSMDPNDCDAGGLVGGGVTTLGCIGPFRAVADLAPDAIFDETAAAWSLDKSRWAFVGAGSASATSGMGQLLLPDEIGNRQFMIELYTTYDDGAGNSDASLSIYWFSATSGISVLDFATSNGFGIDDAFVFVGPQSSASVPELTTVALVAAALAGLLRRKRG